MERKVIQLPIMSVVVGSTNKFTGIQETGQRNNRPLTVNTWSQTIGSNFSYPHEQQQQSQKEKELEEKITLLQATLKAQTELLFETHATSANTSASLSQQQPQESQEQHTINKYDLRNVFVTIGPNNTICMVPYQNMDWT